MQKLKPPMMLCSAPFAQYYRTHLLTKCQLVLPSFFTRHFPRSLGVGKGKFENEEFDRAAAPWSNGREGGLVRAPSERCTPNAPIKPFYLQPSVGTWLHRTSRAPHGTSAHEAVLRLKVRGFLGEIINRKMGKLLESSPDSRSPCGSSEKELLDNRSSSGQLGELRDCVVISSLGASNAGMLQNAMDQNTSQSRTLRTEMHTHGVQSFVEASRSAPVHSGMQEIGDAQQKAEDLRKLCAQRFLCSILAPFLKDLEVKQTVAGDRC